MDNNRIYDNWLLNQNYISPNHMKNLIHYYNNSKNLYEANLNDIYFKRMLTEKQRQKLSDSRNSFNLDMEYDKLLNSNIKIITNDMDEYPENLRNIYNSPYGFYYLGNTEKLKLKGIAIVGSRKCSYYGKMAAEYFAENLVKNDIQIISGMADGIDGIAQMKALESNGNSISVLGSGIDVIYPRSNESLYYKLIEKGGIISEYPLGTPAIARNFPIRNRLISALSDGVLVIEAKKKSGTLITVDRALEQGKDVFAVPGRICDENSQGVNWLISQGAYIVNRVEDIINIAFPEKKIDKIKSVGILNNNKKNSIRLETIEELVYSMICFNNISIDSLSVKTGLNIKEIMKICTNLEIKGLIKRTGIGYYSPRS